MKNLKTTIDNNIYFDIHSPLIAIRHKDLDMDHRRCYNIALDEFRHNVWSEVVYPAREVIRKKLRLKM